jgi:hypothetical protein
VSYPRLFHQTQELQGLSITVIDQWYMGEHRIQVDLATLADASLRIGDTCALVRPQQPDCPLEVTGLRRAGVDLIVTAEWSEELGRG